MCSRRRKDWRAELNKFLLLYRTTPHATTGECPATVFFGRNIKNDIPEYKDSNERQCTELDRKDSENKKKMKQYADSKRNSKDSEIQENDSVLVKNLWKNDKLSPNWLNEKFKVVKVYRKSALLENEGGTRYYRNKAHLKKYYENEKNEHATAQEKDSLTQDVPTDNAQNVVGPTRSNRRLSRANANAGDANIVFPNSNNNSSMHENDNTRVHENHENDDMPRMHESNNNRSHGNNNARRHEMNGNNLQQGSRNTESHSSEENNEDAQGNVDAEVPTFVPDAVPTAIRGNIQVERLAGRGSRKKKK